MIQTKDFTKPRTTKNQIKSTNPLEKNKVEEIKQFLLDNKDTIAVRWSTVPSDDGKADITYQEINVFVKTPDEYRKLFSINGFNKAVKNDKTNKYESVEMSIDEKKRITLDNIAYILKTSPEKILDLLNKMVSSRQKYPKAFYSQVEKVIAREKLQALYKGSALFEHLDETLKTFDAEKLDVMASKNTKTGDVYIGFLDKEIESLGRKPQYILKVNESELQLPEFENPGKFINSPDLGKIIEASPLKPKLEFTRNITDQDGQKIIEYRYTLSRELKKELEDDKELEVQEELEQEIPTLKIKK